MGSTPTSGTIRDSGASWNVECARCAQPRTLACGRSKAAHRSFRSIPHDVAGGHDREPQPTARSTPASNTGLSLPQFLTEAARR